MKYFLSSLLAFILLTTPFAVGQALESERLATPTKKIAAWAAARHGQWLSSATGEKCGQSGAWRSVKQSAFEAVTLLSSLQEVVDITSNLSNECLTENVNYLKGLRWELYQSVEVNSLHCTEGNAEQIANTIDQMAEMTAQMQRFGKGIDLVQGEMSPVVLYNKKHPTAPLPDFVSPQFYQDPIFTDSKLCPDPSWDELYDRWQSVQQKFESLIAAVTELEGASGTVKNFFGGVADAVTDPVRFAEEAWQSVNASLAATDGQTTSADVKAAVPADGVASGQTNTFADNPEAKQERVQSSQEGSENSTKPKQDPDERDCITQACHITLGSRDTTRSADEQSFALRANRILGNSTTARSLGEEIDKIVQPLPEIVEASSEYLETKVTPATENICAQMPNCSPGGGSFFDI